MLVGSWDCTWRWCGVVASQLVQDGLGGMCATHKVFDLLS